MTSALYSSRLTRALDEKEEPAKQQAERQPAQHLRHVFHGFPPYQG
jgi:hypothetical protein